MAVTLFAANSLLPNRNSSYIKFHSHSFPNSNLNFSSQFIIKQTKLLRSLVVNAYDEDSDPSVSPDAEVDSIGVKAALSVLNFYKSEISPLLPRSCRYVPTCSEYSMIAYKKYGFLKGSALTAWRICRCNPLGGSGFDPPRWFGESDKQDE